MKQFKIFTLYEDEDVLIGAFISSEGNILVIPALKIRG